METIGRVWGLGFRVYWSYIGIMEKKMETIGIIGVMLGLYIRIIGVMLGLYIRIIGVMLGLYIRIIGVILGLSDPRRMNTGPSDHVEAIVLTP